MLWRQLCFYYWLWTPVSTVCDTDKDCGYLHCIIKCIFYSAHKTLRQIQQRWRALDHSGCSDTIRWDAIRCRRKVCGANEMQWLLISRIRSATRHRHMNTPSLLTDTKGLGRDDWTKCWDNLNFISLILHGAGCWSMNNPQNKTTCHRFATDTDITHIQTYFAVTFCHFISKPDLRFPPHWKLKCYN